MHLELRRIPANRSEPQAYVCIRSAEPIIGIRLAQTADRIPFLRE